MRGQVKWFNAKKGFGFIVGEDGLDYFVHFSQVQSDGYRTLFDGAEVAFEPVEEEKGFAAHCIEQFV